MRALRIFEKFVEDSDPIEDLGIGIRKLLEKAAIDNTIPGLTRKDTFCLKKFFKDLKTHIYYLGDHEDLFDDKAFDSRFPFYTKNIKKLLNSKNLIFEEHYEDDYVSSVKGYKTEVGKIAVLKSKLNDHLQKHYFADVDVAFNLKLQDICKSEEYRDYI